MANTRSIFTERHAELFKERAGAKYRPSNGTEGDLFISAWCGMCERDRRFRARDFGAASCDIVVRTFAFDIDDPAYPVEWIIATDGQPSCTAFVHQGDPISEPRCEHTHDMFGGGEDAH